MVCYLFTLIKLDKFSEIFHHFPIPGHSFLPCDRCFGLIEKERRRRDRIHILSEWESLVKRSSRKCDVFSVKQDMIYNYADFYKTYFKKVVINSRKEKFAISKYRLFKYSKQHMTVVRCSVNSSGVIYSDFCI